MPTSLTASCPFALSCSTPLPPAGEISTDIDAYELMRGIGNLCVGADNDPRYDARRMVKLLIAGLLQSSPASD